MTKPAISTYGKVNPSLTSTRRGKEGIRSWDGKDAEGHRPPGTQSPSGTRGPWSRGYPQTFLERQRLRDSRGECRTGQESARAVGDLAFPQRATLPPKALHL